MNRSSFAQPLLALVVVIGLLAGLATTIASPATAQAQDNTGASLTLQVSPIVDDQPFRTVAVALDPGQTGLAALGAALHYDSETVVVTSCAVSEVGACNVLDDGRVLVSVFNLSGLRANEQLLTMNFEPLAGVTGQAAFEMIVNTAVTNSGVKITDITVDAVEVEVTAATFGSLTGTVMAEATATALYAIDVCVTHNLTGAQTCTPSSGLGNWRIDDLATGTYSVTASDVTGVYATISGAASVAVVANEIGFVDELTMTFVVDEADVTDEVEEAEEAEEAEPDLDDVSATTPEPVSPVGPIPAATTTLVVVYEASITGQITGLETEAPIQGAQVCATQPFVLHQSCATTDADGQFALAGLSTGNYWVEVVDPLGRFEQVRPALVGVADDEATRTGVNIAMNLIAE